MNGSFAIGLSAIVTSERRDEFQIKVAGAIADSLGAFLRELHVNWPNVWEPGIVASSAAGGNTSARRFESLELEILFLRGGP